MKITIKEIAQLANVSVTTVSNVINNRTNKVSQQTIERINNIIKEYNYTPNMNAKALVNSSSKLIGLLFFAEEKIYHFNNPFAGAILEGIETIAKDENYFVLLQTIHSVDDIGLIRNNWQFSGFIGVGFNQKTMIDTMKIVEEPITFIDTYFDENELVDLKDKDNLFFVRTDDKKLARELVNHLVENGHRKIAFLCYPVSLEGHGVIQERLAGYKEGLSVNGIEFNEKLIFFNNQFDTVIETIDKFTAIMVSADILAIELIAKLKEQGFSVPDDCSVISFDNIQFSELISPKLTTMNLFQNVKGEVALGQIMMRIKGTPKENIQQTIIMDGELEVRESVKQM